MAVPAAFEEEAATRCLSILNSWTAGTNAISQKVQLPASGRYRLTFDMRYACANESRRTAPNVITATGGNINTAYCGVIVEGEQLYAPYPTTADTWEEKIIEFDCTNASQPITLRMGLQTSAGQGAANNTRLYLDNVRLWQQKEVIPVGIKEVDNLKLAVDSPATSIYDISGRRLTTQPQQRGIYIRDGKKVIR